MTPLLAILLLTAAGPSDVHVVDITNGPGADFQFLQTAIDAAADGDVLLVRTGSYSAFDLTGKSLTMAADVGAFVTVSGSNPFFGFEAPSTVSGLAPGQRFVSRGIDFKELRVVDNDGLIWIEDARLIGGDLLGMDTAPLVVERSNHVVLVSADGSGNSAFLDLVGAVQIFETPALLVREGTVSVEAGRLVGGVGQEGLPFTINAYHGAPGVRVTDGSLRAAGTELRGGTGGDSHGNLDGQATGPCNLPGDGGAGLDLSGALAATLDALVVGGAGGAGLGTCPDGSPTPNGQPGPPVASTGSTFSTAPGSLFTLTSTSPVREGQIATLSVDSPTGVGLAVIASAPSDGLGSPLATAVFFGGQLFVQPLAAAGGTLTLSATIGNLAPGVEAAELWAQALVVLPSGEFARTTPTAVLLLDAAF